MNYYVILLVFLLIIGLLAYTSFYLLVKAGGSSLYQNVAYLGIIGLIISLFTLVGYFNHMFKSFKLSFDVNLYSQLLFVLFTFFLFKVWEIRHNQFVEQNYKTFIVLLSLINVGLIINEQYTYVLIISENVTRWLPHYLNVILLSIVNLLFFNFNKISMKTDFRLFPLTILILILTKLGFIFINFSILAPLYYYMFLLVQSGCFLIMLLIAKSDFKKSFYY